MIRFFNLLFSVSSIRPQLGTSCIHAGKKTLNFESLEARQMMHGAGCQIQVPIASTEASIATALTLAEFTAQTGIILDEGVVMNMPVESGNDQITQVDGPDLISTAASSELGTTPPLFTPEKGDANSDGFVNEEDLGAWTENFTGDLGGNLANPAKTFEQGDFDGDGDVDLNDLGWWAQNYTGPVDNEDVTEPAPTLTDGLDAESDNFAAETTMELSAAIEIQLTPLEPDAVFVEPGVPSDGPTYLVVILPAGDADSDGDVDEDDLAAWEANFTGDLGGGLESPATTSAQGDFDGDGDTDLNDLGEWAENYTGPIVPVDESTTTESAADDLQSAPAHLLAAALESSTSPVANPVAGDADADGDVDEDDSATWTANFTGDLGGSESATMTFAQGDFDADGDVDLNDLGIWAEHYTGPIEIGGE